MSSKAQQLKARAAAAAEVRSYQTDPDVIALRLETQRAWVERLGWGGMVVGLAFTAANVQHFAAAGAETYSLMWWTAWLLDPMVSFVLLAVLLGESMTSRYKVDIKSRWVTAAKWGALGATYAMNTWHAWMGAVAAGADAAAWGLVLLHSVPPALVFVAAEALPVLRFRMTEAIERATSETPQKSEQTTPESAPDEAAAAAAETPEHAPEPAPAAAVEEAPRSVPDQHGHQDSEEVPAPAPTTVQKTRTDKGTTVPKSLKSAGETSPRRLSDEELADQLDTAIADARLSEAPSVSAVQKCLGVGFDRAKRVMALRESRTETVALPGQLSVVDAADEATQEREEVAA